MRPELPIDWMFAQIMGMPGPGMCKRIQCTDWCVIVEDMKTRFRSVSQLFNFKRGKRASTGMAQPPTSQMANNPQNSRQLPK